MKLFRRKRSISPIHAIAGAKLKGWYTKLKTAWANWMALRTARLTKKGWITALACLVLVMGSYSTYLIVSAFTGAPAASIKVGSIRKPAHTGHTGEANAQGFISETEFKNIEKFQQYMDSLARDPTGRRLYDSITGARPGLMDSINLVEKYYQQFKNK